MSKVNIFWDPKGVELDSVGSKEFLRITDGDTPYVSMSIRMLSIDTPEVHYPGRQRPSRQDEELAQLAEWIDQGLSLIEPGLAAYLKPKLATGQAGTLQETQGKAATDHYQALLDEKLTRPSGSKRRVFLKTADQPFDQYGRVLAYIAPYYSSKERATLTVREKASFNLMMIEQGWAAPFPIFPSLPKYPDLVLMHEVGQEAVQAKRGVWAEPNSLTGYEFRMCVKLYNLTAKLVANKSVTASERAGWVSRYCVDMTTREIYFPQDYYRVAPWNRIFIWPNDIREAVAQLNLLPAN